jgi:hypothetical protein
MNLQRINFLIIGAQKCGTTTLFEILARHEEVAMSKIKELNFFNVIRELTTENIKRYHDNFNWQEGKIYGEASTRYTQYPLYNDPAKQTFKYNPRIKLIYIIRDPIDRILSQYSFYRIQGLAKKPFEQEIFLNEEYLKTGLYFYQLSQFLKYFDRKNILILFFDDLIHQIDKIKMQLAEFLEIDVKKFIDEKIHKNKSEGAYYKTSFIRSIQGSFLYRPLNFLIRNNLRDQLKHIFYNKSEKVVVSENFKKKLVEYYRDDILKMAQFTKCDLSQWYEKN